MSEFCGLLKHEKTQHALVGLGSAVLAAAAVLPRQGGPNFPKGITKCTKKNKKVLPAAVSCNRDIDGERSSVVMWVGIQIRRSWVRSPGGAG